MRMLDESHPFGVGIDPHFERSSELIEELSDDELAKLDWSTDKSFYESLKSVEAMSTGIETQYLT